MDGGKRKSVSGRSATSKKLRKSNTENKSLKKTIGKQEGVKIIIMKKMIMPEWHSLQMFTENIYKLLPSCYHQCCVHANLRPSII